MVANGDPFPASLLGFPAGIYDVEMGGAEQEQEYGFFTSAIGHDSPGHYFQEDALLSSPYQSPMPAKTNAPPDNRQAARGPQFSASPPDSSLQDSSSDSSGRVKRKTSSRSSHSGLAADAMVPGGPSAGVEPAYVFPGWKAPTNPASFDFSEQNMESDFDFNSAASSPSPIVHTQQRPAPYSGPRHIAIPFRATPRTNHRGLPHWNGGRSRVRGTSPLSRSTLAKNESTQSSPENSNEDFLDDAMLNGMESLTPFPQSLPTHYGNAMGNPAPRFAQVAMAQVPTSFPGPQNPQTLPSRLTVHPTPHKSRVETQIPIKLTLSPLPPGVTRLHLPTHTISKPKLVAKPTPDRSADMLELQTMLVCTSAMQDQTKLNRAFERARQASSAELLERPWVDADGGELAEDDERRPLNGGPVHICDGCITRERKRAARKKSKKPEEDEIWQRDEAKRIVVFNTAEMKEWQKPSPMNSRMNADDPNMLAMAGFDDNSPFVPEGAMQVDVPMRIACYCRHQSEKLGFQVIFTIKDFRDNVVAQTMTLPIIITDDHKTHAPSAMAPMVAAYPDMSGMRNGALYYHDSMDGYGGVPSFRTIRSTPDLQSLQHQPYPGMQHGMPYGNMPPTTVPYATPPATLSHTTSTTLTPRNLSRQGSPSNSGGPAQKKRKASSGKLPDALTMTRLQSAAPPPANLSWVTSAPSYSNSSTAPSSPFASQNFNAGYMNQHQPRAQQSYTNPPTPNSDQTFFTAANRSQSMENFARAQQLFSAPSSALPSRAGSPVGSARVATTQQNGQIQAAVSAMYSSQQGVAPPKPPTIHKLIPNEGPKAGAIEVTCLGSGFCQGLEVMFGDALATTTTFWGETSLVCLLPPAVRAGVVPVTFKHQYQQQLRMQQYPSPPAPKHQVFFRYVDDDEHEVVRLALALVHQKLTGKQEDAGDIARRIVNSEINGQSLWNGTSSQGNHQHRQMANLQGSFSTSANIESGILKCLDLIDLDDSPYTANLNIVRSNGQGLLHLSSSLGYHQLTAALLVRGATSDMRDRNGMTPMHMAALHNYPRIIRRLRVAGADPYIRSLKGFTPADMCSTDAAASAIHSLHNRSRSAGPTPLAGLPTLAGHSRSSTSSSLPTISDTSESRTETASHGRATTRPRSNTLTVRRPSIPASNVWESNGNVLRRDSNNPTSPTTLLPPASPREEHHTAIPSAAAAMAAWRDQLASQITHFQNSVNWTLPNLQLPTLPPLPDYGDHPMVRRISAFVPQRASFGRPSLPGYGGANPQQQQQQQGQEGKERWWDLLGGRNASLPPPYEEIYPEGEGATAGSMEDKKAAVLAVAAETLVDMKFEQMEVKRGASVAYGSRKVGSVAEGRVALLASGRLVDGEEAEARRVMRLRSDRRLFLVWIPLLVLVLVAMSKDRVPQLLASAHASWAAARTWSEQRGSRIPVGLSA